MGHRVNAWELTLELKVGMGEMYSACMNQQNKNRTPPSGRARIVSNLLLRDPLLLLHNLLPHRSWIWIIQRQLSKAFNIHLIRTFHFLITRYYTVTISFFRCHQYLYFVTKIQFCHQKKITDITMSLKITIAYFDMALFYKDSRWKQFEIYSIFIFVRIYPIAQNRSPQTVIDSCMLVLNNFN